MAKRNTNPGGSESVDSGGCGYIGLRACNGEVGRVGRVCIASSEKSKIFLNEYKAAATQATFPV